MVRRIKHNDLLPWFTDDHDQLPEAYLKSCQKFFDEIQATSNKPQASSHKLATITAYISESKSKRRLERYK
jgi:hypothetical protein